MTESERGRKRNSSRLEAWNPFQHGFDVACVFKNLHDFEFVNVNPDRDQTLCPHHDHPYGDHPLVLSEPIMLSDVDFQFWILDNVPVQVMLLNERHCMTCHTTISATFLPTPPQKEWNEENVRGFYNKLLGNQIKEPMFLALRLFLDFEFPDENVKKIIDRANEWILTGEDPKD